MIHKKRHKEWMGDRISQLPDEVLAFILCFLSMRDAVRTRTLSRRWRHLSASLSALRFNALSLFGSNDEQTRLTRLVDQFEFVRAVDQFLSLYRGPNINTLDVRFELGNNFSCHIDNWIKFVAKMKIEKINMDFMPLPKGELFYEFPCHLLPPGNASHLKHLCLRSCLLKLCSSSACQLSSLSSLELWHAKVSPSGLDTIFSSCVNLVSLKLLYSTLPTAIHIDGQLPSLKTLVIVSFYEKEVREVGLSSMNIENLELGQVSDFSCFKVPFLRKVRLISCDPGIFRKLALNLPNVQDLSLLIGYKGPPLPAWNVEFKFLKRLELFISVSSDYDILSISPILSAFPFLETLSLQLRLMGGNCKRPRREYPDHKLVHLKSLEVRNLRHDSQSM